MKSKYRIYALFPALLAVFLTLYLGYVIKVAWAEQETSALIIYACLIPFMTFVWVVMVLGELRTKVLAIQMEGDSITVSNYLGLGASKRYEWKDFDGYSTSILSSIYEDFEFLYLMKNNRKLVKLSAFYHKNYLEMKNLLTQQLPDLGEIPFSFTEEFKEIFQ